MELRVNETESNTLMSDRTRLVLTYGARFFVHELFNNRIQERITADIRAVADHGGSYDKKRLYSYCTGNPNSKTQ